MSVEILTVPGESRLHRGPKRSILSMAVDERYVPDLRQWLSLHQGKTIRISMEEERPKRSSGQNRLFHSICRQTGRAVYEHEILGGELTESEATDLVKAGVKEAAVRWGYPTIKGRPKPSRSADTLQAALLIETALGEAAAATVNVREDIIRWDTWIEARAGGVSPLEGTYKDADEYRERHPYCEACLAWISEGGEIAHIKSRGAGGADADWNWLLLCHTCHRAVQHQDGWSKLLWQYPRLQHKVLAAQRRAA